MNPVFNKKILLLLIAGGFCYGLSFPPINLYFLVYASFMILIETAFRSHTFKQIFFRTYFFFFFASLIAISWISLSGLRDNADTFLIIAGFFTLIVYPLFFVPPVILFFYINKNFSPRNLKYILIFTFPFLWTGFEYLSSLGQINFPWLFAGNTQTYNLNKIQFAEYTGMFGVSFWICLVSVLMYILYDEIKSSSWKMLSVKSLSLVIVLILLYFAPDVFNSLRDAKKYSSELNPQTIKIGIVQPNVDPWVKWSGKQNDLITDYVNQIIEIHNSSPGVKMIVLPETALPYYYRERHFEDRYLTLKKLCDSLDIPILIGTPDLVYYEDQVNAPDDAKIMKSNGQKYDTYNTAVLFEPGKEKDWYQKHQKVKLVIGSERMPYQEILPFTKKLVEWGVGLSSWQIGRDTNVFDLNGKAVFSTAICYESVYPEFFSEFVKRGAQFCVIITNDGWWGKFFGTYQHNRFAVFRAIENRRWIARCANTGISGFIDPEGNMFDETEINVKANIVRDVNLIDEKTFFSLHGDLFSRICLIAGAVMFGVSFGFRRKMNMKK